MHPGEKDGNTLDAIIPFMTMLQIFFYLAWAKVAEELLNPLGTDDDDLETNFIIDRNILMGMKLAEEYYNQFPEQLPDILDPKHPPMYSEDIRHPTHPYKGSAANINFKPEGRKPSMVPHRYSVSKGSLKKKEAQHILHDHLSWPKKLERSLSFPMAFGARKQDPP
uniref:Bestrophin homolog n=1 Tax=Acrobeloides nanus TaxID=290746 RepID=A0A914DWH6_9BILA